MKVRAQIDTPLKLGRAAAANAPARHLQPCLTRASLARTRSPSVIDLSERGVQ